MQQKNKNPDPLSEGQNPTFSHLQDKGKTNFSILQIFCRFDVATFPAIKFFSARLLTIPDFLYLTL